MINFSSDNLVPFTIGAEVTCKTPVVLSLFRELIWLLEWHEERTGRQDLLFSFLCHPSVLIFFPLQSMDILKWLWAHFIKHHLLNGKCPICICTEKRKYLALDNFVSGGPHHSSVEIHSVSSPDGSKLLAASFLEQGSRFCGFDIVQGLSRVSGFSASVATTLKCGLKMNILVHDPIVAICL